MRKAFLFLLFLIAASALQAQDINKKDAKGLKQGLWKTFWPEVNSLKSEGVYKNDKQVGVWKYFYPGGELMVEMEFLTDGVTSNLKMYDQKGPKIAEGLYLKGKKDGSWYYYGLDTARLGIENYKEGVKDGIEQVFYHSGKLYQQVMFAKGKKEGIYKQYFENGVLKKDAVYVNDTVQGRVVHYYPNSKKQMEGMYKDGLREGKFFMYDEKGKLLDTLTYKDGTLIIADRERQMSGEIKVTFPEDVIYEGIPGMSPTGE